MTRREHAQYVLACALFIIVTAEIFWTIGALTAARLSA